MNDRTEQVRLRILALYPRAAEHDRPFDREYVARASIRAGRERGLRMWQDNVARPGQLVYNATTSVERVLGLRGYGRASCWSWVLDLLEAGLDDLERARALVAER